MRRSILVSCLLLAAVWAVPSPSPAAELAGMEFADRAEAGGEPLVLNGLGMRKKAIFKVYVGALYLPEKSSDADAILSADEPRRCEMAFLRGVTPNQLCGAWDDCLAGNTPDASAEVKSGFEQLCGWMDKVGKGDRIVTTYVPGSGSEISINAESKGIVAGKAFADALFACWIGEQPASAELKSGMLGQ